MGKPVCIRSYLVLAAMACVLFAVPISVSAEIYNKPRKTEKTEKVPSATAVEYAKRAAKQCLYGKWEEQGCLKAVSENNLVMAANYGAALQEGGHDADYELIKEHCAASTAATRGEFPAYALRSAFVECANMIYDVSESSGLKPEPSQYQLLVSAVQCLDKSPLCRAIEKGLARYIR